MKGSRLATTQAALALQPQMIGFLDDIFGPYPFTSAGAIVDDDDVGYALETQTRPDLLRRTPTSPRSPTSSPTSGSATASPRGCGATSGSTRGSPPTPSGCGTSTGAGRASRQRFDDVYAIPADDAFWTTPPGDPSPQTLFDAATYDRGGAALQALRRKIGDRAFFTVLRRWTTENAGRNVTTADFVALAESVSRQRLDAFFTAWIYTPSKPALS